LLRQDYDCTCNRMVVNSAYLKHYNILVEIDRLSLGLG
jgi:hypothetical protein